jgi:hypothetical protein
VETVVASPQEKIFPGVKAVEMRKKGDKGMITTSRESNTRDERIMMKYMHSANL